MTILIFSACWYDALYTQRIYHTVCYELNASFHICLLIHLYISLPIVTFHDYVTASNMLIPSAEFCFCYYFSKNYSIWWSLIKDNHVAISPKWSNYKKCVELQESTCSQDYIYRSLNLCELCLRISIPNHYDTQWQLAHHIHF